MLSQYRSVSILIPERATLPVMYSNLGICFSAAAVSIAAVGLLLRCWKFPNAIDRGDLFRKSQERPVLRVGGLAILIGLVAGILLSVALGKLPGSTMISSTILLCTAIFLIGFADDLNPLPVGTRITGQLLVALAAYFLGFRIDGIDLPFISRIELGIFALPITVLWLVALPNIFNLSDGMDGLAGGLGVIVFAVIGTASLSVGNTEAAILAFTMAAATGGFLAFNLPPAKVYLGDGGAYLIGFYAALLAVQSSQKGTTAIVLLMVIAVLAYPMADTTFAICRRFIYGFPIFRGDAEHLHHRMVTLGLPRGWLLALLYAVFMCLALGGLGIMLNRGLALPVLTGVLGIVVLAALYARAYFPRLSELPLRICQALKARRHVRYAIRLSEVLEHELDFTSDPDLFWSNFHASVEKAGLLTVNSTSFGSDGSFCFSIGLGSAGHWQVGYIGDTELCEWNWRKVAQCFVPSMSEALKRFAAPRDCGIFLAPVPKETPSVKAADVTSTSAWVQ